MWSSSEALESFWLILRGCKGFFKVCYKNRKFDDLLTFSNIVEANESPKMLTDPGVENFTE